MRFTTRFIATLISCLLLTGCNPKYNTIPQTDAGPRQTVGSALIRWNQQQPIRLQKHQLIPIDYLEKNPKIKGLIINHYLGTGKTFLAIGFAERNPDRPVIILAPKFLHSHWLDQLDKYGVKNKSRYQFIGHDAPETFLKADTANAVIILDESHRFIERVRAQTIQSNLYSQAYFKARAAHRILSLTGTPIYNDTSDLIYQINLVSGKNIFPFNLEQARLQFSKINKLNAYWRGHLVESMYLPTLLGQSLPWFLGAYFHFSELQTVLTQFGMAFIVPIIQITNPLYKYPLRDFDPKKLKDTITKYISYYDFARDTNFYPERFSYETELSYNDAQLNFLYKFYDKQLTYDEIAQLLKDDPEASTSQASRRENLELNQSLIQETYQHTKSGAGREVGNLLFIDKHDKSKKTIFPEKFHRILTTIKQSQGPTVVYSHYYYNGLLLFKQFLDASGFKNQYRIFHPEMSKEQHGEIIKAFNTNKIKILLLHPDITEGISLKGTRQLHFLEIPINSALQQQIIGRAIRYHSHTHLPKGEQHVNIYIWKQVLRPFDIKTYTSLRKNWHYNFGELNYYSAYGAGRIQIDSNAQRKAASPDTFAHHYLHAIKNSIETFKQYVSTFAIENSIYQTSPEVA